MKKLYDMWVWKTLAQYKAYAGFWSRQWYTVIKYSRRLGMIMSALVIMAIISFIHREVDPKMAHADPIKVDQSNEMFSQKIESLKNGVVEELLSCEGAGYNEDSGLVTYDPTDAQFANNQVKKTIVDKGEMSYGILQFKKSTVITYIKLRDKKDITGKEALLIALDKKSSSDLSKFVMFETKGKASGDWKNCARQLNLDAKIDVIKQLAK